MKCSLYLIVGIFLLSSVEILQHRCHADGVGPSYITATDFTILLNSSAQNDLFHLYEEASENHLDDVAIVRQGIPGRYHYETIQGYEKHPMSFTSLSDDWIYHCWNKKHIEPCDAFDDQAFFKDDFEEIFALNQDKASSKFYQKDTQEISRFQNNHLISNSDFALKSSIIYFSISKSSTLNQNIESLETAPAELWINSSICTAFCLGAIFASGYIYYQHGEYLKTTHFPGDATHNKLFNEYANSVHNDNKFTVLNSHQEDNQECNNLSPSLGRASDIIAHFQTDEKINNPNELLTPEIFHKINNYQSLSSSNSYREITHQCAQELDDKIKEFNGNIKTSTSIQNHSTALMSLDPLLKIITEKRDKIQQAIDNENYALALNGILKIDNNLKKIYDCIKVTNEFNEHIQRKTTGHKNKDTPVANNMINNKILSFIDEQYDAYSKSAAESYIALTIGELNNNSQKITNACQDVTILYKFLADFYDHMRKEIKPEEIQAETVSPSLITQSHNATKNDTTSSDGYSLEYSKLANQNDEVYTGLERDINCSTQVQSFPFVKNRIEHLLIAKFLSKIYKKASEDYNNPAKTPADEKISADYDRLVLNNFKQYEGNISIDPSDSNRRMRALFYLMAGFYNNISFNKTLLENPQSINQFSNKFSERANTAAKKANELNTKDDTLSHTDHQLHDNQSQNSKVDLLLGSVVKIPENTLAQSFETQPVAYLENSYQCYHEEIRSSLDMTQLNNRLKSFYWENAATSWLKAYHARDDDTVKKSFHNSANAFTQAATSIQNDDLSLARIHYEIAKADSMAAQSSLLSRRSHGERWNSLKTTYETSLKNLKKEENSEIKEEENSEIKEPKPLDLSFKRNQEPGSLADFLSFLFCGAY